MQNFDKHNLSELVGKHLVYTYDNGWNYEIYVKNSTTMDYRIHSGIVGNRWVKDQHVYIVQVAKAVFKISWTEPTGTDVSLIINLEDKIFHGTYSSRVGSSTIQKKPFAFKTTILRKCKRIAMPDQLIQLKSSTNLQPSPLFVIVVKTEKTLSIVLPANCPPTFHKTCQQTKQRTELNIERSTLFFCPVIQISAIFPTEHF